MNYFSYFSEIEEVFVRRRGKNLLLSPLDWALIEAWKERGVPLHIVLRAIETVFDNADKQPARKRTIKSLLYCRDEVETQFAAWLETQIGNGESPKPPRNLSAQSPKSEEAESEIPRGTVISHLQKISESLQNSRVELNGSWQSFSAEISSDLRMAQEFFETNGGLDHLESILNELDHRVDRRLPQIVTSEIATKVKTETSAQLRSHRNRMSDELYRETFQTLLIKNLRERTDLPRFSLVYL